MQAYYARDEERDRLESGVGLFEFLRTIEVIGRTMPDPPAVVADIGGGPGRYTDHLAAMGHRVVHRDVVAHHVDQVRDRHGVGGPVDTAIADARSLDLDDGSVDAVLLLGPLYHLPGRDDRLQALGEARRVVRPGGRIYAAAISRWAARLHGIVVLRAEVNFPVVLDLIDEVERTGVVPPVAEGGFTGFGHTPAQLGGEIGDAGFELESLVSVEGVAMAIRDLDERLADETARTVLLDMQRAVESVPDLLGVGPHLLAVGRRPAD